MNIHSATQKKLTMGTVFALAWPALLEQLLITLVQYVDTAMVGRFSTNASAAVGLTTPVGWVINAPLTAIATGCLIVISQSLGRNDPGTVRKMAHQTVLLTFTVGFVALAVTLGISPFLPRWMNAAPEIQRDAFLYFAITCLPMLFRAGNIIFGMAIRATGDTRTPMLVNVAANLLNAILNFFLIYPPQELWGISIPGAGLGVTGAAIATAVSHVFSGVFLFLAFCRNQHFRYRSLLPKPDRSLLKLCLHFSLPVACSRLIGNSGYAVFASMVSGMGTVLYAAHSIANTAESLFYIPAYGMQTAASTLAGFAVGKQDEEMLQKTTRFTLLLVAGMMFASGAILFCFAEPVMSFFSADPEVVRLGSGVLRLVSVSEPFFGMAVVQEGLLNGMGKTRVPFLVNCLSMWCVRILSTALCVNLIPNCSLSIIWCCMIADNVCKFLGMTFYRLRRNRKLSASQSKTEAA